MSRDTSGDYALQRGKSIFLSALGIKGLSEVTEEELQLLLQPLYRSIVFGEDYDAPTVEEMVYTAIISFTMTGVIGKVDNPAVFP